MRKIGISLTVIKCQNIDDVNSDLPRQLLHLDLWFLRYCASAAG